MHTHAQAALADCKTVIWNGPMGVFEMEAFAKGTFAVAETLAEITAKVNTNFTLHCSAIHCTILHNRTLLSCSHVVTATCEVLP
jgi:3-phosphoglycerate kinase